MKFISTVVVAVASLSLSCLASGVRDEMKEWLDLSAVSASPRLHMQTSDELNVEDTRDIFVTPESGSSKRPQESAALLILCGATIRASDYEDLARRVVKNFPGDLYVAVPSFFFDLALGEDNIAEKLQKAHQKLLSMGLPDGAPIYLAGHSLGGAMAQEYAMASKEGVEGRLPLAGTILLSTALFHKYEGTQFPTPWMVLSGELDGMQRPSRIAQTYYHYHHHSKYPKPHLNSAVVSITGMNHMQYSTGPIPALPMKLDLQPEVTGPEAREDVSLAVSAFMAANMGVFDPYYEGQMKQRANRAGEVLNPLIGAMLLEANHRLHKPCNSDTPSPHCPFYPAWPPQAEPRTPSNDTDCSCGTPWAEWAVRGMAALPDNVKISSLDAIHDVRDTNPYHHAHVWNDCHSNSTAGSACVLNVTTVSEPVYERFEPTDLQFFQSTAHEIRVKMKSRQVYWRAAVDKDAPYSLDADKMICAGINQKAYDFAIAHAPKETLSRFLRYGKKMVMLEDEYPAVPIGPLWINSKLKFKRMKKEETGEEFIGVVSPSLKTTINGIVNRLHPDSGGQHYCKLLSPARVLEWIYTDGLRYKMGVDKEPISA